MVHPITGETISSYKKLIKDPATAEVWQTEFGKEFGGMAQGDNKTGQKGTNAMFVMNHNNIKKILKAGKKFTYANLVVDFFPQKKDPNRIRIVAGGNLIDSAKKSLVPAANIGMAKLHWNSVVSTALAKIYVHRHQEFLPFSCVGVLQVHEDTIHIVSTMDHRTV
jgi:hypothetical protein